MELFENVFETTGFCQIWLVFVSKFYVLKGEEINKRTSTLTVQPGFLQ